MIQSGMVGGCQDRSSQFKKLKINSEFIRHFGKKFCNLQKKGGWSAGTGASVFLKSLPTGVFAKILDFQFPEAVPQNMGSLNPTLIPDVVNESRSPDEPGAAAFSPVRRYPHCGTDIATVLYCPDRVIWATSV